MEFAYTLTPEQTGLITDALRNYKHQHVEIVGVEGDTAQESEHVIDEIDTLLPLFHAPREVKILSDHDTTPRSRHIIDAPTWNTVIETSPVTDGTATAIRHGISLLEARSLDDTDRSARRFLEDLNSAIERETTYEIDGHSLDQREVFDVITVILRAAQRHVKEVCAGMLE